MLCQFGLVGTIVGQADNRHFAVVKLCQQLRAFFDILQDMRRHFFQRVVPTVKFVTQRRL
jgi:hypothetical protein